MHIMYLLKVSIVALFNTFIYCAAYQTTTPSTVTKIMVGLPCRRKRSLLLPSHGSIKITIGLGKALIASSPKGLSLSWEISNYYSGPSTINDWLSEVPHQPMRKSSEILNITNTNTITHKKHFQIKPKKYQNLLNPYYGQLGSVSYANSISPVSSDQRERTVHQSLRMKQMNRYTRSELLREIIKRSDVRSRNALSRRIHNGRGTLEEILTLLLGTDVRCSILRSICTSKQFLLPPGYSMIQDLVRTMFLISTPKSGSDEVTVNLCDNTSHCNLEYENSNSLNFLDWILNPIKIV